MKCFFITVMATLSLLLYSCNSSTDAPETKATVTDNMGEKPAQEDTFRFHEMQYKPVYWQPGVAIDRFTAEDKRTASSLYVNFPVISKQECVAVNEWIQENLISDRKKDFRAGVKEMDPPDYSNYQETVNTIVMYNDGHLISIAMLETFLATGTYFEFEHMTFNYDIVKKKQIQVTDYFILDNIADTLFLNRFLDSCVGGNRNIDIRNYADAKDVFPLAVDTANVYFFFGRHHLFGIIDKFTSVPKRLIWNHIRPEYR